MSESNNKGYDLLKNWPENISYHKSTDIENYFSKEHGAVTDSASLFHEKKRILEIFIFAMALGKNRNSYLPWSDIPKSKKSLSMPTDALTEEEIWLMTCVAISHENKGVEVIKNPKKIVEICEGYANGGIALLLSYDKSPNPLEKFEEEFESLLQIVTKN